MANYQTAFPSKYLRAVDLGTSAPTVTIDRILSEVVSDDPRLVCYFKGQQKGVVLNKTNATMLSELSGDDDTDRWSGLSVTLRAVHTTYQGRPVLGIRFEAPSRRGRRVPPPPPPPVESDGDADSYDAVETDTEGVF